MLPVWVSNPGPLTSGVPSPESGALPIALPARPCTHDKINGRTQTGLNEASAQSLSADCDLDYQIWHIVVSFRI